MKPETPRTPVEATIAIAVLLLFLVGGIALSRALGLEWNTESVRAFVDRAGAWGPLVFIGLGAVRGFLLIPGAIYLTAGGVAFGALEGSLYGGLGLTATALWQYGLVRWAGPDALIGQIPVRMRSLIDLTRTRTGIAILGAISSYPLGPIPIAHIAAAIAGLPLGTYTGVILAGSIVRAGTYSLFGNALFEGQGRIVALAVLATMLALPWLIPSSRAWIRANLMGAPPPARGDESRGHPG